ncbi:MAG: hypothetical protein KUA38_12480, partial [Hydrogenophaga sp.]|nr:hypothetical protein [Hydrogenophaga sp.]
MSEVANMDVVGDATLNSEADIPQEGDDALEGGGDGEGFGESMKLTEFIDEFGDGLLSQVKSQNPAIYDPELDEGTPEYQRRKAIMFGLKRQPFKAQADAVQASVKLLVDHNQHAVVINAEMGTGKTMMAICAAAAMQATH